MLALGFATPSFAQGLTGGERVFFEKGQCNQCHGKFGNGVGDDPRENGANLRESALDRETMIMMISCGVPGTNMPYFDKFSYTDDRCYGMTEADIGGRQAAAADLDIPGQARHRSGRRLHHRAFRRQGRSQP